MPYSSAPTPGRSDGLLGRVGRACYTRRRLTVLIWILGVACLVTLGTRFGAPADNSFIGSDPGQTLLNQHFPRASGATLTLAVRSSAGIESPAVRARVTSALILFERAPHATSVSNPYQAPGQISRDGHIAFATVRFNLASAKIATGETRALMNDARAASGNGVTFSLGGDLVDTAETPYSGPSQGIGVGAAAIVLLITFGSLLAMSLPIITAVLGIGAGLSLIALLGHLFPAPSFSPIIASLIGLGVGVDYALFIVTRFRESLRVGATPQDAAVTAMRTAGRTVLVAGSTVVIGLLGLLVLRQPLFNGVAVAAAATVATTLLGSLTLLPALLGFTGTRLAGHAWVRLPRRHRAARDSRPAKRPAAERWAALIQRRPVIAAVLSAGVILALAAPALGMKLNMPDESAQARSTMGYQSYTTMTEGFGSGFDAPLIIAARLASPGASTAALAAAVRAASGVAHLTPVVISSDRQAAMMIAYPATGEQDTATSALVNRLHDTVLPRATRGTGIRAYVTGPDAGNVTFANAIGQRLPWLIAIVVALSMMLLLVMFRSVTIAIKAAAMNLLSISAAFGVLVAVTQHGWGRQLFGFPETMPVTTWVPVFLFVILFGLSLDYEVFLLSRIKEEYDRTGDNAASVARGLARTARVISAAAAIMVVVFLSFVLGADVSVKQIGLGLAVAVLIDATVVRMVLVPAVMELLGTANWWLPRSLARILPRASISEDEPPAEAKVPVPAVTAICPPAATTDAERPQAFGEREKVHFPSGDTTCAAWYYPGTNGACVIMAGGGAVTKEPGTDLFAKRFNEAGFAVLAFDYRRLGESGGQPRLVVRIRDQLADWQAAIGFAPTQPGVDPARLAIWGFSLSGGHVFRVAARNPQLAAAIAQTPNADGQAAARNAMRHQKPLALLRLTGRGVLDTLGGLAGRRPLLVPLAGQPGTVALLTTPDAPDGDRALNPDNKYPEWQQEVAARSALRIGLYRPGRSASRVRCPLLVLVCEQDQSALAGPAARAAKRAPSAELVRMPGGHYEPFLGGHERAAQAELSFLRRHLLDFIGEASLPPAPGASGAVPGHHRRGTDHRGKTRA